MQKYRDIKKSVISKITAINKKRSKTDSMRQTLLSVGNELIAIMEELDVPCSIVVGTDGNGIIFYGGGKTIKSASNVIAYYVNDADAVYNMQVIKDRHGLKFQENFLAEHIVTQLIHSAVQIIENNTSGIIKFKKS